MIISTTDGNGTLSLEASMAKEGLLESFRDDNLLLPHTAQVKNSDINMAITSLSEAGLHMETLHKHLPPIEGNHCW